MGRLDERDLDFEELFASPLPHFHQTKTLPVHQNQTITFAFPFKLILSRHSRNYRTLVPLSSCNLLLLLLVVRESSSFVLLCVLTQSPTQAPRGSCRP